MSTLCNASCSPVNRASFLRRISPNALALPEQPAATGNGRAKPSTKHLEKIEETLAVDGLWLISGKKRRGVESPLNPDNHAGSSAKSVVLEPQAGYQETFDKETLAIAAEYFALSKSQRKLVRDLLRALKTAHKAN